MLFINLVFDVGNPYFIQTIVGCLSLAQMSHQFSKHSCVSDKLIFRVLSRERYVISVKLGFVMVESA